MLSPRLRGALFIAAATLCWSTGGILVRSVSVDDWTVIFYRSFFLVIAFAIYLAARHGAAAPQLFHAAGWSGVLSGLLVSGAFVFFILAMTRTLVATVLVILSAAPLVSAILGRVLLGEQVRPHTAWAIAAAMVGIALMFTGAGLDGGTWQSSSFLGNVFALCVALCFGANIVVVRRNRNVDMVPAVMLAGLFAMAFSAPLAQITAVPWTDMILLALMGIFQLGLGFFFFLRGTPHLTAAEVGLLTLLETVFNPLWVWIGIGETPGARTLLGGGVVLSALVVHSLFGIRRSKPPVGMT